MTTQPAPITIEDIRRAGSDWYGHARWILDWLPASSRPAGRPPGTDGLARFASLAEFTAYIEDATRAAGRLLTLEEIATRLGYGRRGLQRAMKNRNWPWPT